MQITQKAPKQYVMTFNSKDFTLGLSPLQQFPNQVGGFFATATAIDVYRYPGMIAPGPKGVNFSGMTSITGAMNAFGGVDVNGYIYGVGDKLYKLSDTTVQGGVGWPHTYSAGSPGNDVCNYTSGGTVYLIYFLTTDIGLFDGTTYVDNWGSGTGSTSLANPTNHVALGNYYHKAVAFAGKIYFTNGNIVGSLDGTTNTLNTTAAHSNTLVLPSGYVARDIRVQNGNLEVYANAGAPTKGISSIFIWDGVSTQPSEQIDVDDNYIGTAKNLGGFPHLFTSGRNNGFTIRKKNYWGYQPVQTLKGLNVPSAQYVDTLQGMMVFANGDNNKIHTFGTPFEAYSYRGNENSGAFPEALNCPFVMTNDGGGSIIPTAIKTFGNKLIASSYDGANSKGYLQYFDISDYNSWNSSQAVFQTNFFDLPMGSTIDYIRIYVLNPDVNCNFTPYLYTNFATNLGNWNLNALNSTNLDVEGNSKTYYEIGAICNSFAIGGTWGGSSTTAAIIITQIDVGYHTK